MRALFLLSVVSIAGCSSAPCDAVCGPCEDSLTVNVTGVSSASVVTLDGVACGIVGSQATCHEDLSVGAHDAIVVVDGVSTTLHVTIAAAPAGCCTCSPNVTREIAAEPTIDGGAADAGAHDGGGNDAGSDAGSLVDGGSGSDAGLRCDPSAVRFSPSGGSLEEGQLCDDVFACVASHDDGVALMAVAPEFSCTDAPDGPCSAVTCRYGTSTLDAAELAEVCDVTLLSYVEDMVCMVYL
jgi:hypothetical protein